MVNITGTTCNFGLAQVDGECSRTFDSYHPNAYLRTQIIYLSVGFISVVASGCLYYRAVKHDSNKLQKRSTLLCVYVALTLIFRSADPNSYRHVIPHPIVSFFSDSSTGALYAIFYWASVIQAGAAHIQRPLDLTYLEWVAVGVVWVFYLAIDMFLFLTKGFFTPTLTNVQMLGSASILTVVGVAFLVYGLRVRARLVHFERQKLIFEQRHVTYQLMNAAIDLNQQADDNKAVRSREFNQARVTGGHAVKIIKILVVVETFVTLVIAAQIYTGVHRSASLDAELDCANGENCSKVRSSVNFMHWFQLASIWVVLWVFRKVEKRAECLDSPDEP